MKSESLDKLSFAKDSDIKKLLEANGKQLLKSYRSYCPLMQSYEV